MLTDGTSLIMIEQAGKRDYGFYKQRWETFYDQVFMKACQKLRAPEINITGIMV